MTNIDHNAINIAIINSLPTGWRTNSVESLFDGRSNYIKVVISWPWRAAETKTIGWEQSDGEVYLSGGSGTTFEPDGPEDILLGRIDDIASIAAALKAIDNAAYRAESVRRIGGEEAYNAQCARFNALFNPNND